MPTLATSWPRSRMMVAEKFTGTSSPFLLMKMRRVVFSLSGGPYSSLRMRRIISAATSGG